MAGLVDRREDRPRVPEEALARGQQLHAPRRAQEQRRAELVLQAADLPAQRRLRDMQAPRGTTDVLLLGDGDEVAQLREAHARERKADPAAPTSARSKRYQAWRRDRAHPAVNPTAAARDSPTPPAPAHEPSIEDGTNDRATHGAHVVAALAAGGQYAGSGRQTVVMASANARVMRAIMTTISRLGPTTALTDAIVNTDGQVHIFVPLPQDDRLSLCVVIDAARGNLALARLQMQRLVAEFRLDEPATSDSDAPSEAAAG